MTVMAEFNRDNFPSHADGCHPHPQSVPFRPDPQLGLTPDKSPCRLGYKKTVRFSSPDKVRARRKVEMCGKENIGLAGVQLSTCDDISDPTIKSNSRPSHKKRSDKSKKNTVRVEHCVSHADIADHPREGGDSHLDTPELHTTLNIGRDILKLQSMNIDIVEAVKHRLTVSDQDRIHIKQKTFTKLNERPKSPSAFNQTVSVNVAEEQVIEKVERQLGRSVRPITSIPQSTAEKPTLMKFFKPELAFHRSVSTDQHGYQPRSLQIRMPRTDQAVFEHHERIALWETK